MRVYLAGCQTGFQLTDPKGQPTETLHVMVRTMGAVLCQAEDLTPTERRRFTDTEPGVLDPVFKGRWFIRGISERLRYDRGAAGSHGWAWTMFRTDRNLGLLRRCGVREVINDEPRRVDAFLVVCPPDWELSQFVYEGLWKWDYSHWVHHRDGYAVLEEEQAGCPARAPESEGVTANDGHADLVLAAGRPEIT